MRGCAAADPIDILVRPGGMTNQIGNGMSTAHQNPDRSPSDFLASHAPVLGTIHHVGSADLELTRLKQTSHQTAHKTGKEFVISNGVELNMQRAEMDAGFGKVPLLNKVGPTLVHPSATDAEFIVEGDHTVQVLVIEQSTIGALFHLDDDVINRSIESIGYRQIADPMIFQAVQSIWQQTLRFGPSASLMTDGLLQMIMSRLFHHAELAMPDHKDVELTQMQLAQILDVVEANLNQTITLGMLAARTGLPAFKFAAAFEHTTGEAPHQFLLLRRLSKACRLLSSTDTSIELIASTCGFSSTAHLTVAFSKHFGSTPLAYRQDSKK